MESLQSKPWLKQLLTWTLIMVILQLNETSFAQPVPGMSNVYGHALVERVWGPDTAPRTADGRTVPIPRLSTNHRSWLDDGVGFPPGKLVAFHAFLCTAGDDEKGKKGGEKKSPTSPVRFDVWKIVNRSPPTFKLVYTQRALLPNDKKTLYTVRIPDDANLVLTKPNSHRLGWTIEDSACVICFNMTAKEYMTHWEPVANGKYPAVGDKLQFSAVPIPVQFSVAVEVETIGILAGAGQADAPEMVMQSRHHAVPRDRKSSNDEL